ncbi:MAG: DNA cytosine methyltransferase, partial [Bacteroidaceae bacterium]|nr:DNA cytosine methyltransferase [Bacteroidaceae bacterium]
MTFVDLFAGAGGISEGFLQAYTDSKYYDFVLASDINENCELTHRARYNEQLGLGTKFVTEDIMSPTFVTDLQKALEGKEVDVVTGGPSCQSFSLSGRRKRFDKRDGLFSHYLKVIRALRPKYFVMENVKGLLTKDKGRFRVEIMREMRSIIDNKGVPAFMRFAANLLKTCVSPFFAEVFTQKLLIEISEEDADAVAWKEKFFDSLDAQLKKVTREIEYRVSKSNKDINTIRHGLALLRHNEVRERITADIINEKTAANIDNDWFVDTINEFLMSISDEEITTRVICSFDLVEDLKREDGDIEDLKNAIRLYSLSLDECLDELGRMAKEKKKKKDFDQLMKTLRLYNVEQMVLLSSDYGVPQNRERVVFIGSRNDQEPIKEIPATVKKEEKVTVYEAISDLDFIGNGEVRTSYTPTKPHAEWDGLIRNRKVDGQVSIEKDAKKSPEWSRAVRLSDRFAFDRQPLD